MAKDHSLPGRGAEKPKRQRQNKRTPRACDQCRFKKAKCDGCQPCMSCQANDRSCIYSARRRRDARNWYCGMQGVLDEALQRLYIACKDANAFPGNLPINQDGRVTTEDILNGLGLATEPVLVNNIEPSTSISPSEGTQQPTIFKSELADFKTSLTPSQSSDSSASIRNVYSSAERSAISTTHNQNVSSWQHPENQQVATPAALDMCEQFAEILSAYPPNQGDIFSNQASIRATYIDPFHLQRQAESTLNPQSNGSSHAVYLPIDLSDGLFR